MFVELNFGTENSRYIHILNGMTKSFINTSKLNKFESWEEGRKLANFARVRSIKLTKTFQLVYQFVPKYDERQIDSNEKDKYLALILQLFLKMLLRRKTKLEASFSLFLFFY